MLGEQQPVLPPVLPPVEQTPEDDAAALLATRRGSSSSFGYPKNRLIRQDHVCGTII